MNIRTIGPDDWADWRQARTRALTECPEAYASSVTLWTGPLDTEKRWRDRLAEPGAFFVAFDHSVPVGMVGAVPTDNGVELISMWVDVERRHCGVGGQLIGAAISWADGRALTLRVIDGNEAAVAAYRSKGFVLVPDSPDAENCKTMIRP